MSVASILKIVLNTCLLRGTPIDVNVLAGNCRTYCPANIWRSRCRAMELWRTGGILHVVCK
jgi:hypothetical protein